MRRSARHVLLLTRNGLRAFRRDRTAAFFAFLLPVIFIVVFSLVFGDDDLSAADVRLVGEGPVATVLPAVEALDVQRAEGVDEAVDAVRDGDAAAAVIVSGDDVDIRYAASDPVRAAYVRGVMQSVIDQIELRRAGAKQATHLTAEQVEDDSLSGVDFYLPGILAFAISTSAVIGLGTTLVHWRASGLLRRLRLAPVSLPGLVASRVLVHLVLALAQTALLLMVGVALFGLDLPGNLASLVLVAVVGALAFMALGLVTGAIASTEDAAAAIGNVITLPMAFLSGVFFPLDNAPGWLQAIGDALPMRWVVEALRDVTVRDAGLGAALPELGVLLAFTAVVGGVSLRLFRWDRR